MDTQFPELNKSLDGNPERTLVECNLARLANEMLLQFVLKSDLFLKECARRKMVAINSDLAGPDPSPLESLLIERVVSGWLQVHLFEILYTNRLPQGMSLELERHYQRLIQFAQKRYLASIKALATVRKILRPTLQLNLARHQVNIGAGQVNIGDQQLNATMRERQLVEMSHNDSLSILPVVPARELENSVPIEGSGASEKV